MLKIIIRQNQELVALRHLQPTQVFCNPLSGRYYMVLYEGAKDAAWDQTSCVSLDDGRLTQFGNGHTVTLVKNPEIRGEV